MSSFLCFASLLSLYSLLRQFALLVALAVFLCGLAGVVDAACKYWLFTSGGVSIWLLVVVYLRWCNNRAKAKNTQFCVNHVKREFGVH